MAHLDTEPKHGQNDTTKNGEVTEPKAERRSIQNWKRNMEASADGSVEHHDQRNNTKANSDARESLTPLMDSMSMQQRMKRPQVPR